MVGDKSDGYILVGVCLILYTCYLTYLVADSFHCINIEYCIYILNNNRKSLKTHTCIYVLLLKLCIIVMSVTLELCEHIVPYFHETVTVTAYLTVRLATAILESSVIVNL